MSIYRHSFEFLFRFLSWKTNVPQPPIWHTSGYIFTHWKVITSYSWQLVSVKCNRNEYLGPFRTGIVYSVDDIHCQCDSSIFNWMAKRHRIAVTRKQTTPFPFQINRHTKICFHFSMNAIFHRNNREATAANAFHTQNWCHSKTNKSESSWKFVIVTFYQWHFHSLRPKNEFLFTNCLALQRNRNEWENVISVSIANRRGPEEDSKVCHIVWFAHREGWGRVLHTEHMVDFLFCSCQLKNNYSLRHVMVRSIYDCTTNQFINGKWVTRANLQFWLNSGRNCFVIIYWQFCAKWVNTAVQRSATRRWEILLAEFRQIVLFHSNRPVDCPHSYTTSFDYFSIYRIFRWVCWSHTNDRTTVSLSVRVYSFLVWQHQASGSGSTCDEQ